MKAAIVMASQLHRRRSFAVSTHLGGVEQAAADMERAQRYFNAAKSRLAAAEERYRQEQAKRLQLEQEGKLIWITRPEE